MSSRLEFSNQQQDDKLPLKTAWGSYFYKADKQRDWKQNVIYITSINYVEDFWSLYTHTFGLRDLSNGSDYMFFKVIDCERFDEIWIFDF
jgi:translation initiation factor 4E